MAKYFLEKFGLFTCYSGKLQCVTAEAESWLTTLAAMLFLTNGWSKQNCGYHGNGRNNMAANVEFSAPYWTAGNQTRFISWAPFSTFGMAIFKKKY